MTLSANTLFHFTRDYETLIKILKSRFYPRLHLEECMYSSKGNEWAIPMACFCDIPLSSIAQHTRTYGKYAIGIKKTEAINQGVSPILYVHKNSGLVKSCRESLCRIMEKSDADKALFVEETKDLLSMFSMMKPYEGLQVVDGKKRKIRFYDEREWRYLPPMDNLDSIFLLPEKFHDGRVREKIDKRNEQYGVTFTPDAINYIIVEKEEEILPLMDEIGRIKGDFSHNSVKLLTSRILSLERIQEDF